jgi:TonB-dependent starch-binding outer membrane protein SusC
MRIKEIFLKQKLFMIIALLLLLGSNALAQVNVTGKVIDTDNQPVVGANIVIKGTTTGTMTGIDGKFVISAPSASSIIVVSFIGYVAQEFVVGNNSVLNITLQSDATALSEVVVIGYGTVKKRDLTGAVASVSGSQIASVPVSNAAQAMVGRLPGVTVTSQDGRPGAQISIRVRGGGSISQSNEPLYIVDGFPSSSISDIPGDQIESISVLKDASSTAIYGARGANGVILVTTKGAKADKMTITYSGYGQFNEPTRYLETMDAYDYIAYNWAYAAANSDSYAEAWERLWAIGRHESTYSNSDGIDHYKNVNAQNYQKEVYGSSFSQSHNLSIANGNEKTKYLLSGSYLDDSGMKINSGYERINASFKLDQKLGKKLDFNFDTRYTNTNTRGNENVSNGQGSILSSAYMFRPIATTDILGELNDKVNIPIGMYDDILQDLYNPVSRIKDQLNEDVFTSLRTNISLNWNVLKGLTARTEFGLTNYWEKINTWQGSIAKLYLDQDGNKTYAGDARIRSRNGWNLRWANTLLYEIPGLGSNHSLNVMAGYEVSNSASAWSEVYGDKFPVSFDADRAFGIMSEYYHDPASPGSNHSLSSNVGTPSRLLSYFGRINYSMLNRYLLTVTFRTDGSSRFSPSNRWGYFPAGALAWRISEESFMKNISWLDNLKLRFSYGSVGNDGISADLWTMKWKSQTNAQYSMNEVIQSAYIPASNTLANPNLKWETTITRNLGLDFAILKSRVFGTIELYKNSTKDLLMLTEISAITGFSTTYDNIGSTSNKGIEISLGAHIIEAKDFHLSVNFNINLNQGQVDELAPGVNGKYNSMWNSTVMSPSNGDYILEVGKPVGQVRGFIYDGWYTTDDFTYNPVNNQYTLKTDVPDNKVTSTIYGTQAYKPTGQSAYPGVVKFKDISGPAGVPDGVVNDFDITVIGNMNPKHTGGFNINGDYKGFDFALNFNWSYGSQIYNANKLAGSFGQKEAQLYRNRFDELSTAYKIYDIQNGQLVRIHDPEALDSLNVNATMNLPFNETPVVSSYGIEDGSFLRLNTVTLGYTLPKAWLDKVKISRVRVYGTIYNALTFTNYSGLDPELNTQQNLNNSTYPTVGLDWGTYPRARAYTFGVNIEF